MNDKRKLFTPWSSLDNMLGKPPSWWPEEDRQRIAAYEKYDQMYWNDPTQYAIRVLENEQPLYVPNARVIVDTTCQWLMKGFRVSIGEYDPEKPPQKKLDDFLKRERFYSKFNINKQAGVARGDCAFHITANPLKPEGSRVSIDTLHPGQVHLVSDEDDPDEIVRIHLVEVFKDFVPNEGEKERIRKLTYHKLRPEDEDNPGRTQRIAREEAIYELDPDWWGPAPKKVKQILEYEVLPEQITQFPVYWYPNIEWESQQFGSSELRGLEYLEWAVSQGTTDTQMALALEGLGVYATDGGRPVDDQGKEQDWEVAPGKVMEVPAGSYFRRVEGVGSITPMMEQLKFLEQKMYSATGMTDVALGQVDVAVAQSGIALAIKFMPTLARIDQRDVGYKEITEQMWFDIRSWFEAYDRGAQIDQVDIQIDPEKLPKDPVTTVNELNNMYDRKIISRKYYRIRMKELGHDIPDNMDEEIIKELEATAKMNAATSPEGLRENAEEAAAGRKPITNANGGNNEDVDNSGNQSNNQSRPNESSGTEA